MLDALISSLPSSWSKGQSRPRTGQVRCEVISTLREKQFFSAAKAGDRKKFLWYLRQGYPVDMVESNGRNKDTALIAACRLGRTDIVHIALEYDAKNDPHPEYGQTALQVAVASGHCECAQLILETAALSEADHIIVNHEDSSKEAPIHVASRCGNLEMLKLLMKHGAIISLVDSKARTSLHCAAQAGHHACLRFLLQVGGGGVVDERDNRGLTALHMSVQQRNFECTRALLESGANVEILTPEGFSPSHMAKKEKCRNISRILLQYGSKSRDIQDNNLFEGLHVFQRVDRSDFNRQHIISAMYPHHQHQPPNENNCTLPQMMCYPQTNSHNPQDESFLYQDESWFIFYHESGYPYFFRVSDSHSQWEDPRLSGVSHLPTYNSHQTKDSTSTQIDEDGESYLYSRIGSVKDAERLCHNHDDTNEFEKSEQVLMGNDQLISYSKDEFTRVSDESSNQNTDAKENSPTSTRDVRSLSSLRSDQSNFPDDFQNTSTHKGAQPSCESIRGEVEQSNSEMSHIVHEAKLPKAKKSFPVGDQKILSAVIVPPGMKKDGNNNDLVKSFNSERKDQDPSIVKNVLPESGFKRYNKMLSVGVPHDAVVQRMKKDGLGDDQINLFNSDKKVQEHNIAKKRLSQRVEYGSEEIAMKVPSKSPSALPKEIGTAVTIFQKGVINSVDDGISSNKCNAKMGPYVASHCDDDLSKFRKMLAVGVPFDSVIHKMSADGVDELKIQSFQSANGGHKTDPLRPHREDPEALMKVAMETIKSDGHFAKYNKMSAVGVPPQSIANKMRQDGIDRDKIDLFECAYNLSRNTLCQLSLPLPPPKPSRRRTSVAMQKIHWKTVSEERLGNSLWANATDSDNAIDDSEVKQLENLFGAKESNQLCKKRKTAKVNQKTQRNSLIDIKRSNNIAIALAQFKTFQDYDELCSTVSILDSSKLNREQLENMTALLPTDDELRKVKGCAVGSNGLGRAEMFFISVSKIPRFAQKLRTFIFILQFAENVDELKEDLSKLDAACKAIISNRKLAAILKRLLAIGNLVNEGAGKSKASGITIDSLLKTANKAGSDGKTKVIDVVLANFLKNDDSGDTVNFWTEIKCVNVAARIEMQECKNSFRNIQTGVRKVNMNIEKEERALTVEEANQSSLLFLQRCKDFIQSAQNTGMEIEERVKVTERSFEELCTFFAEDATTCKASSIFEVVIQFATLVQNSANCWRRKAKAEKRKHQMNTPIKTSRRHLPSEKFAATERKQSKNHSLAKKASTDESSHLTQVLDEKEQILHSIKIRTAPQLKLSCNSDDDSWDDKNN